jgi:hypothetical protein
MEGYQDHCNELRILDFGMPLTPPSPPRGEGKGEGAEIHI